jgi:alanyl-tRNA synthetase
LKETIRECAFDQEAFDIWKQFVPEDRYSWKQKIILGNGDQGPCGPCSEIHIDLRTDEEERQFQVKFSQC